MIDIDSVEDINGNRANVAYYNTDKNRRVLNLMGLKFGELTVLGNYQNGKWECQCSCGNLEEVTTAYLNNGRTRKCFSCIHHDKMELLKVRKEPEIAPTDSAGSAGIWRRMILAFDLYTCQICKVPGKVGDWINPAVTLHVHHLNTPKLYIDDALKPNNGITLCKTCHEAYHKALGGCNIPCCRRDFDKRYPGVLTGWREEPYK